MLLLACVFFFFFVFKQYHCRTNVQKQKTNKRKC